MQRIYKYVLTPGQQGMKLPDNARPLHVGAQNDEPVLWARVDPEAPQVERAIWVVGTGQSLDGCPACYVGTAQVGRFVWHVFDGG